MASKQLAALVQAETANFLGQHCQIWNGLAEKVAAELVPTVAPLIERIILASFAEGYADPRIAELKESAKAVAVELEKQIDDDNDWDGPRGRFVDRLRKAMEAVPDQVAAAGPVPRVSLHQLAALRNAGRLALGILESFRMATHPEFEGAEEAARLLRAALGEVPNG